MNTEGLSSVLSHGAVRFLFVVRFFVFLGIVAPLRSLGVRCGAVPTEDWFAEHLLSVCMYVCDVCDVHTYVMRSNTCVNVIH